MLAGPQGRAAERPKDPPPRGVSPVSSWYLSSASRISKRSRLKFFLSRGDPPDYIMLYISTV